MAAMQRLDTMRVSEKEYLALDAASERKFEYVGGKAAMMAGVTPNHSRINTNLILTIAPRAGTRNCRADLSDIRVMISSPRTYVYPDFVMTCGEAEFETVNGLPTLVNPTVIIEILSDSTAKRDLTEKRQAYYAIPSLRTLVLVEQERRWVEVAFRREDEDGWRNIFYIAPDAVIPLESIGVTLTMDEIYANVILEEDDELF